VPLLHKKKQLKSEWLSEVVFLLFLFPRNTLLKSRLAEMHRLQLALEHDSRERENDRQERREAVAKLLRQQQDKARVSCGVETTKTTDLIIFYLFCQERMRKRVLDDNDHQVALDHSWLWGTVQWQLYVLVTSAILAAWLTYVSPVSSDSGACLRALQRNQTATSSWSLSYLDIVFHVLDRILISVTQTLCTSYRYIQVRGQTFCFVKIC